MENKMLLKSGLRLADQRYDKLHCKSGIKNQINVNHASRNVADINEVLTCNGNFGKKIFNR